MKPFLLRLFGTVSLISIASAAINISKANADDCEIKYPARPQQMHPSGNYPKMLLQAAIKVTESEFGPCKLVHVGGYSRTRKTQSLIENDGVDVAWLPATKALSAELLHVSVPIRKGLLGWRLLLIHTDNIQRVSAVKDIDELNTLSFGYGADWVDLSVLQDSFDTVVTSPNFETLYTMLSAKRFEAFPRAVHEAEPEVMFHKKQHPNMIIAPNIALYYPQVDLFYVNKANEKLHNRLSKGLFLLIENGSFDRLFNRYHLANIKKAKLGERTLIELPNKNMPTDVLFEDPRLWVSPLNLNH